MTKVDWLALAFVAFTALLGLKKGLGALDPDARRDTGLVMNEVSEAIRAAIAAKRSLGTFFCSSSYSAWCAFSVAMATDMGSCLAAGRSSSGGSPRSTVPLWQLSEQMTTRTPGLNVASRPNSSSSMSSRS